MNNQFSQNYQNLYKTIYDLYHTSENKSKLLFHGWHHIKFVHDKAIEFAKFLKCDVETVAAASLVHDLNYIFSKKLEPEAANLQIANYLKESGYDNEFQELVLDIIKQGHIGYRDGTEVPDLVKALADADTLFKALPTTPILFASKFITENNYSIAKLAAKVVDEQKHLLEQDMYFYTDLAKEKYMEWAKLNIALWENVQESLEDESVKSMLDEAYELGVL